MPNKKLLITSQMPATHFIAEWTGINNAAVWLEAEEKENGAWNIYALGQSEKGRMQKWAPSALPEQGKLSPPRPPSFTSNAHEIHSAQCCLLAENKTFSETLTTLVFFEGLRQEGKMHYADIGDMQGLSKFKSLRHDPNHIYRQWSGAAHEEKLDSKTLDDLNSQFRDNAQKLYTRIKDFLSPS